MLHLDTNYLIRALISGTSEAAQLDAWVATGETIGISAMAWAEFLCGPLLPAQVVAATALVGSVEVITAGDSALAANLFNLSGRRRGTLADCLIAAVAIRLDASLAIENRSDFAAFSGMGLRLVP